MTSGSHPGGRGGDDRASADDPVHAGSASGRPTTASASVTSCADGATGSCSPRKRRGGAARPLGFEEDLVDLRRPRTGWGGEDPGPFWKEFIRDTAPEFRKPTVEQLDTFIRPIWSALIDGARYCEQQLRDDHRADAARRDRRGQRGRLPSAGHGRSPLRPDHVVQPAGDPGPARAAGILRLRRGRPTGWTAFRAEYDRTHRPPGRSSTPGCRSRARPRCPTWSSSRRRRQPLRLSRGGRLHRRSRPLDATWHRMDSSVRGTDERRRASRQGRRPARGERVDLPVAGLARSADVELMRRRGRRPGRTPHRYIVSKGPRPEIELADNMVGAEFLPQTNIIPQGRPRDHAGGNNTITESLHFGKPMIVLPLFWDQYDNAQRMDELGFGVRLETYAFTDADDDRRRRTSARRHRAARPARRSARAIRAVKGCVPRPP